MLWNMKMSCRSIGYEVFGEKELHEEAIRSFKTMQRNRAAPPTHVLLSALKACGCLKDLNTGIEIHHYMAQSRRHLKILVWNSLMCMYAKCGHLQAARSVLGEMPEVDVVSWNSIIFGFIQSGEPELALQLFSEMQHEGFKPDSLSFVAALKACAAGASANEEEKLKWLRKGLEIHSRVSGSVHHSSTTVANSLLHLYTRCGSLGDAKLVFDRIENHDVVSWTALISGFAEAGTKRGAEMALEFFSRMQLEEDLKPNRVTLVAALKACASGGDSEDCCMKWRWLEKGMAIHSFALESGFQFFQNDLNLSNSLLAMYAKCGSVLDARWVFERMRLRSVVSWTSIIFGYVDSGESEVALTLFSRMLDEGFTPDAQTFVAALKACASSASKLEEHQEETRSSWLERTFAIHSEVSRSGIAMSNLILANNLVQAYAKCGSLRDARELFESMEKRSTVSWNTMLNAYADAGEGELALQLLSRMRVDDRSLEPDAATFVGALKACGSRGALETGRIIHGEIKAAGLESNNLLQTSLVDMYGKCGSMLEAQEVFDAMAGKDLVAWSALIGGYSLQGDVGNVLRGFEAMEEVNDVVFLHLLTACSHSGLVDEGKRLFDLMVSPQFSIAPGLKHYSCLVDLLARANRLNEALGVVRAMPLKPDATIWTSILSASRKWGNDGVARVAFHALVELDQNEAFPYVLFAG